MASYDSVLGTISGISSAVGQGVNAVSSIFSSEQGSANSIRNTYLSGFFNEGNSKFTPNVFSRLFDEPTYLTFRIEFNFDNSVYNAVFDSGSFISCSRSIIRTSNRKLFSASSMRFWYS